MALIQLAEPYTPLSGWFVFAAVLALLAVVQRHWAWQHAHLDPEAPLARVGAATLAILSGMCGLMGLSDRSIYFYAIELTPERVRVYRIHDRPWWIERDKVDSLRFTPIGKNSHRCELAIHLKNGQTYRSLPTKLELCQLVRRQWQP